MPTLDQVTLTFSSGKDKKTVFDTLSVVLPQGETTAVMGVSGSGKTTLLRLLAGIISPDSGNVTRETERIAFVFQDTALLPWLTAEENVNLVLSDTKATLPLAKEWLARVGLADECTSFPSTLSGGMRQRVALARARAVDAYLLLLDEPFRGLDESLHEHMLDLIREIRQGKTTVLVTHDRRDLRIAHKLLTLGDAPMLEPLT